MSNIQISLDQIKAIQIPGEMVERKAFEKGVPYPISIEELDEENLENTIVYKDYDKGQSISLRQLLSMYVADGTREVLVENNQKKVIPFGKGKRVKQLLIDAGKSLPKFFTITEDEDICAGATQAYLDSKESGAIRKAIYAEFKIDTSGDVFPQLVTKSSKKSAEDVDNWRISKRSLVQLDL